MVKVGIITLSVVGDRTLRTPLRAQLFLPVTSRRKWVLGLRFSPLLSSLLFSPLFFFFSSSFSFFISSKSPIPAWSKSRRDQKSTISHQTTMPSTSTQYLRPKRTKARMIEKTCRFGIKLALSGSTRPNNSVRAQGLLQ